jgi:VIT1/CCC1 family predicted Fe2+/Mn2+ transporter
LNWEQKRTTKEIWWAPALANAETNMASEKHRLLNIAWLRAAVLGANDGIISTASLLVGVSSAGGSHQTILLTGISGLVAGAMSMAAGEYVSVSSQADTERADLATEKSELAADPDAELKELAGIYEQRGLASPLAKEVAQQLMARDPLAAHARDELGITELSKARPLQAAFSSAAAFSVGASVAVASALLSPRDSTAIFVFTAALLALFALGALSARASGTRPLRASLRVTFWGAVAMAVTAVIGRVSGHSI